jgi:transcriptional regulator with XRE-family HTH domain
MSMKLADHTIRRLAAKKGLSLSQLLADSRVSRTAYYSLARQPTVLPKSIHALAHTLGVRPLALVVRDQDPAEERAVVRMREIQRIQKRHPTASFDNLWHTLCLLEQPPLERLNRSLTRGRASTVYR